jgi:hypothetical protein
MLLLISHCHRQNHFAERTLRLFCCFMGHITDVIWGRATSVPIFLNIHNPWCGDVRGDVNTCERGANGNKESAFSGPNLL